MDAVYLFLIVVLFALTAALVPLFERLMQRKS